MIIWINDGFGTGKTTLAQELHRRLLDTVVYDPEDVGLMLGKQLPPGGDFRHLPSCRELAVADQAARELGMTGLNEMAAADRQPGGTAHAAFGPAHLGRLAD